MGAVSSWFTGIKGTGSSKFKGQVAKQYEALPLETRLQLQYGGLGLKVDKFQSEGWPAGTKTPLGYPPGYRIDSLPALYDYPNRTIHIAEFYKIGDQTYSVSQDALTAQMNNQLARAFDQTMGESLQRGGLLSDTDLKLRRLYDEDVAEFKQEHRDYLAYYLQQGVGRSNTFAEILAWEKGKGPDKDIRPYDFDSAPCLTMMTGLPARHLVRLGFSRALSRGHA
jgi:hypothetical protein